MILFLTVLALWAGWREGNFKPWFLPISISLLTAVIADLIIGYYKDKKTILPSSAVITGLIVALVMAPGQKIIYYSFASLLAILSKHLIRIEKRQLFNPAGFGLLATSIIFSATLSWWGLVNPWFITPCGVFIVYKIRRFPVIMGYLLTMSFLLSIYAIINKAGILEYLSVINLFFVFIMLIEPMTSPFETLPGWLFGVMVAIAGFIFYLYFPQYDFALSGLAVGNLSNLFLRRLKKR